MATQQLTEYSPERKGQVKEVVLAYRRLPAQKKERVDKLFCLLEQADDPNEQEEIAIAVCEILVPEMVGLADTAGKVVDLEEGVSQATKDKVDAYRKHVGAAIRKRRGELRMTQDELAVRSGIPQSHISKLEDGRHAPTAVTIDRLAKALDTEPSKLDVLYD